jgi:GTP-binding protein
VEPGDVVYGGQICGENSRDNDMVVNPCKARSSTTCAVPRRKSTRVWTSRARFALEEALEYINDDELVEVTPTAIRMRKRILDHNERRRAEKDAEG